ncbi:hypothetical protein Scani_15640 [Streptomyces caniferus]|uniref:Uncharacterized protein n=1 Tax=Streptomyces caniferus TaxID=285557 RepID=A0A640S4H3_9ACTN|nr:hypothetical protein Scani_15640 [Streptomyces caniferus]
MFAPDAAVMESLLETARATRAPSVPFSPVNTGQEGREGTPQNEGDKQHFPRSAPNGRPGPH